MRIVYYTGTKKEQRAEATLKEKKKKTTKPN